MKKQLVRTRVVTPNATHMREIPFAVAVALNAPREVRTSPALIATHFQAIRRWRGMPQL